MFKKVMTVAMLASALTACKSTPPPAEVQLTNIPSVSYKMPLDQSIDISFNAYNTCVSSGDSGCVKYDSIKTAESSGDFLVEKRVHNGTIGSGAVYTIKQSTERTADANIVTYQPVKMTPYQQGFILPFAVPSIDIAAYLKNSQFKTKFEINSEYPSQSVKANFDRLMKKVHGRFRIYGSNSKLGLEDYYMTTVDGAKVVMLVESFPYRNGSKVVVNAIIETKKSNKNVIDVAEILKSVKAKVAEVTNA
ncbi:hypothetical protein P4S57_15885 [Pseudoalteromonas sp. Hal273]|jgi:hypothetical protein